MADVVTALDLAAAAAVALATTSTAVAAWAEDKGRLFASKQSGRISVAVILIIAAVTVGVSAYVLRPVVQVDPYLLAIPLPFVLCGLKVTGLRHDNAGQTAGNIAAVATLGFSMLLRRLHDAMSNDVCRYMDTPPCRDWPRTTLQLAGEELYDGLSAYVKNNPLRKAALEANMVDFQTAIARARASRGYAHRDALKEACGPYKDMKRQAYLWRYDIGVPTKSPRLRRWWPWGPPRPQAAGEAKPTG